MKTNITCITVLAIVAFNSLLFNAQSQSVCVNFDDCGNLSAYEREHTFNLFGNGSPGCLADWEVTSGTPSVYGSSLFAPYTGTGYALFGIHNSNTVEGAALKFNFEQGKTYTVSMAIANYNSSIPLTVDYYLLDTSIAYTYTTSVGASAIPAVPATALKVDSITNFTSNQWQTVSFTVSNLSQNYSRLWIRQFGPSSDYLFIDSLCISEQVTETCIDFDDCGNLSAYEREHTFNLFGNGNPGCLADWEVTSGTPSVYGTSLFAPYNGAGYALFGVHNSSTVEGAALKHSFVPGKTYTISMAIANYNSSIPLTIDCYLLDTSIAYTYTTSVGASAIPAVPTTALRVDSIANFTSNQWQNVSFTFSNLSQSYSRFWIRQFGVGSDYLFIDHLCIAESNTSTPTAIVSPTAIEEPFVLFPNPSSHELKLITSLPNAVLSIYDLRGKLVVVPSMERNIDITMLSNGIYIAELHADNKVLYKKFVKAD